MKKRSPLTVEDVYKKPIYKNIIYLIYRRNGKLQFAHLQYAMVKNHGIDDKKTAKLKKVFDTGTQKEIDTVIKKWKTMYGSITANEQKKIQKGMRYSPFYKDNIKFSTKSNISNHLYRLKELELIDTINEIDGKKCHPRYIITDKGQASFLRFMIKTNLDEHFPDDRLHILLPVMTAIEMGKKIRILD